ncbi:MAG TPA: HAMP domain-containing sensor histidine kinase [Actinomycetota bacterium]
MAAKRSLPLGPRLVLTHVLIAGAVLLVVAALVFHLTRVHLLRGLDARLSIAVQSFQQGPARQVARPADLPDAARSWLAVHGFTSAEVAAVRTSTGPVLSAAGGMPVADLPPEVLDARSPRWWEIEMAGEPVRALTVPLLLGDRTVGTLVVGSSRADIQATLDALVRGMLIAAGLGLALAAGLGLAAVRRTLRPLRRMTMRTDEIEATGDLSLRVSGDGPRDEVGRLAESFDAMLERLDEAFRSRQRFVADASHELRTPLTVVRGQLELLRDRLEAEGDRASVGLAMDEIDRMRRIVEELLLLARLDEGLPLERAPVEVELLMQEALVRGLAGERRRASVDAEPGLLALADPERLLQVLTNLVANAVKHAGEDARISLRARRADDRVVVEVADTGRGIPPEELPHVFSRLFRGTRARGEAGAGLGLSIASSLVEAMDGGIRVSSREGAGTVFTVELPLAAPAAAPADV